MASLKAALREAYKLELEGLPSEEELRGKQPAFSPDFERRMKRMIRRADHPLGHRVLRTAACLLLGLALSGACVLALAPEARAALEGWVREMYESWFIYRRGGERGPVSEDRVYCPAWVPEGYEETAAPQAGTFVRIQYENGDGELLTVAYLKGARSAALEVEWEGAQVQPVAMKNANGDLYWNLEEGPSILVWTDEERDAVFWITAPLGREELIRVAESIRESEPMPRRYCVSLLPMQYGGGYYLDSLREEPGWGETVYGNGGEEEFFIAFGYSADRAAAPRPAPDSQAREVLVNGRSGRLYLPREEGGDKTLLWTAESGDTLWVRSTLPEEDLLLVAENAVVKLNRYDDLIDVRPVRNEDGPLSPAVERVLTPEYVALVEDCARRTARSYDSGLEEYNRLWRAQLERELSPQRKQAIERVSAMVEAFSAEPGMGETILSLFGPFYTASIRRGVVTTAHICNERGVMIADYNSYGGQWTQLWTPEETQFINESARIYHEALRAARAELAEQS